MFEHVEIEGKSLRVPAMAPKLDKTPGKTRWPGPPLGEHTFEVLVNEMKLLSTSEYEDLKHQGIIQ